VSVEEAPRGGALDEAMEALRRRGYLGGHGTGVPRRAVAGAYAMTAAGLALVLAGLVIAVVLPHRPSALLATAALLAPVFLLAFGLAWPSAALAEAIHRRGLSAGIAAAGTGAAGAAGALGLAYLGGRPWAPPWGPGLLAGAVLAALGAVLVLRGLARAVILRILRRPVAPSMTLPRLWRVTAATLAGVVMAVGLASLPGGTAVDDQSPGEALHVRPGPARLAVVAVDGASCQEVELLSEGSRRLAGMTKWRRAELDEPDPGASLPVRWITVATGASPGRRGVATFRQVAVGRGGPVLLLPPALRKAIVGIWSPFGVVEEQTVPAAHRKVPTVWEMASRAGLPVRVLGWWGSFPPRRVRGVVASERWLLTGTRSAETVFPGGPASRLGEAGGTSPLEIDRRALAALDDAALEDSALVMLYLPGWWLERRGSESGEAPLLTARALEPHLGMLGQVLERLLQHGYTVCIVGLRPGRGWVLWSAEGPRAGRIAPADLVDTWLDALGLPPASSLGGRVRRDLSGLDGGRIPDPACYGPPPPLAASAPVGEGAAQLELLKSLGYLN